jgi:hypothetical protein
MKPVIFLLILSAISSAVEPARPKASGLFTVWVKDARLEAIERMLPYLRGGQAVADWSEIEPSEGQYDFSRLDQMLALQAGRKRYCTVQVNASNHPDYLYNRIPVLGKFEAGPTRANRRGHLQYWHPDYVAAYQRLLRAFGAHFKASPNRAWILGVRLNWNALSTEHMDVPAEFREPALWQTPKGAKPHPVPFSAQVKDEYQRKILATFIEAFSPEIKIFCRNNVAFNESLAPLLIPEFENGRMGLFHTSSEVEPRGTGGERQYRAFTDYCRSGKTVCYAEPWADAEGNHGGKRDARWCSPVQWNYWTQLANLHCGVSSSAIYGADLIRANEPEFKAAFDLVDRYAGYHASPATSPGAWIAFREGDYLKGDYTFLMQRVSGGEPVKNVGPADQRFGAWARRLRAGETMSLRVNPAFARSLKGAEIRVIYLDEKGAPLQLAAAGVSRELRRNGTGRWVTEQFRISGDLGEIRITAPQGGVLHWVEVER